MWFPCLQMTYKEGKKAYLPHGGSLRGLLKLRHGVPKRPKWLPWKYFPTWPTSASLGAVKRQRDGHQDFWWSNDLSTASMPQLKNNQPTKPNKLPPGLGLSPSSQRFVEFGVWWDLMDLPIPAPSPHANRSYHLAGRWPSLWPCLPQSPKSPFYEQSSGRHKHLQKCRSPERQMLWTP